MRFFSCFIFTVLLLAGCVSDNNPIKEVTQQDLMGEWQIYHATRNGKVTKSLESGNFVFQADNLVSSNLFTNPNSLNFTYDKGTIKIEGDPNIKALQISQFKNDTLILSSKLKVFEMEFYLVKK